MVPVANPDNLSKISGPTGQKERNNRLYTNIHRPFSHTHNHMQSLECAYAHTKLRYIQTYRTNRNVKKFTDFILMLAELELEKQSF